MTAELTWDEVEADRVIGLVTGVCNGLEDEGYRRGSIVYALAYMLACDRQAAELAGRGPEHEVIEAIAAAKGRVDLVALLNVLADPTRK